MLNIPSPDIKCNTCGNVCDIHTVSWIPSPVPGQGYFAQCIRCHEQGNGTMSAGLLERTCKACGKVWCISSGLPGTHFPNSIFCDNCGPFTGRISTSIKCSREGCTNTYRHDAPKLEDASQPFIFKDKETYVVCKDCNIPTGITSKAKDIELTCKACGKVWGISADTPKELIPEEVFCLDCTNPLENDMSNHIKCSHNACNNTFKIPRKSLFEFTASEGHCKDCNVPMGVATDVMLRTCEVCGKVWRLPEDTPADKAPTRILCSHCKDPRPTISMYTHIRCSKPHCENICKIPHTQPSDGQLDYILCGDCSVPEGSTTILSVNANKNPGTSSDGTHNLKGGQALNTSDNMLEVSIQLVADSKERPTCRLFKRHHVNTCRYLDVRFRSCIYNKTCPWKETRTPPKNYRCITVTVGYTGIPVQKWVPEGATVYVKTVPVAGLPAEEQGTRTVPGSTFEVFYRRQGTCEFVPAWAP